MNLTQNSEDVRPVAPGDAIVVVDENYVPHAALVVCVHGPFGTISGTDRPYVPCINAVYISADEAKTDGYGRQLERLSSLQHYSQGPDNMPAPGRYWVNAPAAE